ncbi:MAG TPA: hypothetical protein VF192_05205 [Longimicrobiales bacterium]
MGRVRVWLERCAHLLGIAIIAWLLADSLRPRPAAGPEVVGTGGLAAELRRWSTVAAPGEVHLTVDSAVSPAHREWLAALAAAGTGVSWDGDSVPPLAVALDPVPDPAGGTRIWATAPPGTMLVLEDDVGAIDSVAAGGTGARFSTGFPLRAVRVRSGAFVAESVLRDSISFGRVLVVGRVGWESGMVTAALEERGWEVDARLALSPKGDVVQGGPLEELDPARYSAVIVLDSAALVGPGRLVRYVREGGGLVITARAASAAALAPLRVGRAGRVVAPVEPFDTSAADPRRSLGFTSIVPAEDAVPLELRGELVAVAARRVDRGRVVLVGYDDTWRWRMAGGAGAVEAHRAWWAALVASVARVDHAPLPGIADEAPLATMVQLLGSPSSRPAEAAAAGRLSRGWAFAALAAALLLQWLSRRLRGAP